MSKLLTLLCEKEICILFIFMALWSILFCFVLSFPFLCTLISVFTLSNTYYYYSFFSWNALFPFFLSIVIFTFLLVSSLLFLFLSLLSSVVCVFLLPTLWWVLQLALLQYRLNMSSMLYQPPAPPGSGTLHTYQVLLPFHSGFLEVNLREFFHRTVHLHHLSAPLTRFPLLFWNLLKTTRFWTPCYLGAGYWNRCCFGFWTPLMKGVDPLQMLTGID